MNALHQYLFDTYRAARLGEPPPPAPGTYDVAVLRAALDRRRFERLTASRPTDDGLPSRPPLRPPLRLRLRLRLRAAPRHLRKPPGPG
ncbi:hypothetical protein [Streptomyces sp. NPDC003327]